MWLVEVESGHNAKHKHPQPDNNSSQSEASQCSAAVQSSPYSFTKGDFGS